MDNDRNNKGNCEPDNLGQLAFVLSFFVDKTYPLIAKIVDEARRITENGLLTGLTDYNHHEIYSTLWLKLALERLDIDTSFIKIPNEFDSYARMLWMYRQDVECQTPYENKYDEWYPYLWWAVKHFENEPIDESIEYSESGSEDFEHCSCQHALEQWLSEHKNFSMHIQKYNDHRLCLITDNVSKVFNELILIDINDGVTFDILKISYFNMFKNTKVII